MRVPDCLLTESCTLEQFLGDTPSGPTYGSAVTSRCRLELKRTRKTDLKGKDYFTAGRLFLPPTETSKTLPVDSRVVANGKTYLVDSAIPYRGFLDSHVEVILR